MCTDNRLRLRKALSSTRKNDLLNQAKSESKLLQTYDGKIPSHEGRMYSASQVDSASVQILDMFHPIMNTDSNPLQVIGDGNCLYRSVSLAMTGTQQLLQPFTTVFTLNCFYKYGLLQNSFYICKFTVTL